MEDNDPSNEKSGSTVGISLTSISISNEDDDISDKNNDWPMLKMMWQLIRWKRILTRCCLTSLATKNMNSLTRTMDNLMVELEDAVDLHPLDLEWLLSESLFLQL